MTIVKVAEMQALVSSSQRVALGTEVETEYS